jgi:hypothetical protein
MLVAGSDKVTAAIANERRRIGIEMSCGLSARPLGLEITIECGSACVVATEAGYAD